MDGRTPRGSGWRTGALALVAVLAMAGLGLAVGSGWLVACAAIGVFEVAAAVGGRDSRAPGDWRGAGTS
jgi:hypothetical protein